METSRLIKKAEKFFHQQNFEEITRSLTDKVLEEQNNAELYAWRARANHRLNKNIDITMRYAEKATSADPNYFMGYFARACAWDDKKDYNMSEPLNVSEPLNGGQRLFRQI